MEYLCYFSSLQDGDEVKFKNLRKAFKERDGSVHASLNGGKGKMTSEKGGDDSDEEDLDEDDYVVSQEECLQFMKRIVTLLVRYSYSMGAPT